MKIEIGKTFAVIKDNKTTKWKVIEHPYFDSLALVRNYNNLFGEMKSGYTKSDDEHICGKTTLETAYEDAYLMS